MVGLLCLNLLQLGAAAQTVAIVNLSIAKETHRGARFIGAEVSILNEKTVPLTLTNQMFYVTDPQDAVYGSLSRMNDSSVLFREQLNPGAKMSQHLWFEIPADADYNTLRLCLHAADSMNWDDYLEIPLYSPIAAKPPMLHPANAGDPPNAMSYARMHDLVAPRVVSAPDPKLPPGGREFLSKSPGKISSTVGLVVDRQGLPKQLFLVKSADARFDPAALRAVSQYRFKPATDHAGNPVAVRIDVTVTFRSY